MDHKVNFDKSVL